jgi:hypothetical protein
MKYDAEYVDARREFFAAVAQRVAGFRQRTVDCGVWPARIQQNPSAKKWEPDVVVYYHRIHVIPYAVHHGTITPRIHANHYAQDDARKTYCREWAPNSKRPELRWFGAMGLEFTVAVQELRMGELAAWIVGWINAHESSSPEAVLSPPVEVTTPRRREHHHYRNTYEWSRLGLELYHKRGGK